LHSEVDYMVVANFGDRARIEYVHEHAHGHVAGDRAGLGWAGVARCRSVAATTWFPEETPRKREAHKLAALKHVRFFIRFHGVSSGSAECGTAPVPPGPSQPDHLSEHARKALRISQACAKPANSPRHGRVPGK
jgi:hypothetical protein